MRQSLNRTPGSRQSDTTSQPGGEAGKEKVKAGLMGLFKRSQSRDVQQPATTRDSRDETTDPKARPIYEAQSQDHPPLSERRSLEDKIIPVAKYRDPNNRLEDSQF